MSVISEWSAALVEDLLFRQFMRNEDVSHLVPPQPQCNPDAYLQAYEQATRMMQSYVRNGPAPAPLSYHSVNVSANAQVKSACTTPAVTPVKQQQQQHPQYAPPPPLTMMSSAPATTILPLPRTPNAKQTIESISKAIVTAKTPKSLPPAPISNSTSNAMGTVTIMKDTVPPPSLQPLSSAPPSPSNIIAKRERPVDPLSPKGKKSRIEWPTDVPNNAALKSKSRSQVAHLTSKRVQAQQMFDPDLVFQQPAGELPLHIIFADFPKALKAIAAIRGSSGDWHDDTFTLDEEAQYKRDIGIEVFGPSQCTYSGSSTAQELQC